MSRDLDELYQSVILDHDRRPRNFRPLEGEGCREAEGFNPLCGDRFKVMVQVDHGAILLPHFGFSVSLGLLTPIQGLFALGELPREIEAAMTSLSFTGAPRRRLLSSAASMKA